MDSLDKFFRKYSYKFPKGYPDLTNEQDINLLADLLEGLGINLNEFKTLQAAELKKRENLKTFIDKFYKSEPFETQNGEVILSKIIIKPNEYLSSRKDEENKLYSQISSSAKLTIYVEGEYTGEGEKKEFKGTTGKLIKTEDFGGLGKDFISKETQALNKGNEIFKTIASEESPINIKVGNNISKNCTALLNQPGNPKADFYIEGDPKIYISHKDGNSPSDFYRWGGISFYKDDNEITNFIEAIKDQISNDEFKSGQSFYREIDSEDLKLKIVYGKEYGSSFNINNVNCVIQGDIKFEKIEGINNTYELKGENMWLNGDIPSGEYTPVLFATYRTYRNDFGIKNSEILVVPLKRAGSSKKI